MKKLAAYLIVWFVFGLFIIGQPPRVKSQMFPMGASSPASWRFIDGRCDGSSDGNGFTTVAKNYSLADIVFISIAKGNVTLTVTSTGSPVALTGASIAQNASDHGTRFYYDRTVSASYVVTTVGASSFSSVCTLGFKGAKVSSPFDQENGAIHVAGGGATFNPGAVTPTTDNQVIITNTSFVTPAASSVLINSGFTKQVSIDLATSQHYGQAFAFLIQSTAAAVNPQWSGLSNIDSQASSIATFKGL